MSALQSCILCLSQLLVIPIYRSQNPLAQTRHILKEKIPDTDWWTGLAPEKCPGFDPVRQCLVALPQLNLQTCTRQQVLDYFTTIGR